MKLFKKKIKEIWRKEATIKIRTLLEVTENPKGFFNNKEKLINITIDKGNISYSNSFDCTKKGKRDLLKLLVEELFV